MTFATYTIGVPNPPNNPSADVFNMQTNTNSISALIGIDHVGFNLANGGYHTVIHQTEYTTLPDPVAIPSIGQLYVKKISVNAVTDDVLFFQSGAGRIFQLTGAPTGAGLQGSIGANGWTFLPNGLIMQWGTIVAAISQTLTAVTFAGLGGITFPQNCFIVLTSPNEAASTNANNLNVSLVTNTGFTYYNTSGSVRNYFWQAIGN